MKNLNDSTPPMTKKEEALARIELLTKREREIGLMTANGMSSKEIADTLCTSEHTIKTHRYNLYRRLRVENNVAVAIMFTLAGLVHEWKVAA